MTKNVMRALLLLSIVLPPLAAHAQSSGQLSFLAYHCTFDEQSRSVQIDTVSMQDATIAQNPTFTVTRVENGAPIPNTVSIVPLESHNPLKVTLVVDLTDTFPLGQVVNVLHFQVINFLVDDETRIISFGGQVKPPTEYTTDHGTFANVDISALEQEDGEDNRLYDALYAAVSDLDATSTQRQIILVMTDSKRKPDVEQRSAEEIITLARASKAQIFAIGLKTAQDEPDAEELQAITSATGGYAWIYQGNDTTGDTLQQEFASRWDSFMAALNTEVRLTIPAAGLQPDADTDQVSLNLVAAMPDGSARRDQISCPIKILNHTIAFSDLSTGELLVEPKDIHVVLDPPLDESRMVVEFWLNDQMVQSGTSLTYRLDPATLGTAADQLQARLQDKQTEDALASTQLVEFTTQRTIQLQAENQGEATGGLIGTVQFTVTAPPDLKGKDVHFILRGVDNPAREYPLGLMIAPLGDDGTAVLTVEDIAAQYNSLPDDITKVEALAYIEGEPGQRVAISQPIPIIIGQAPSASLTMPLAAGGTTVVLVLVNAFLMGRVRRQRTLRLTEYPDNNPLPENPMYLTVTHRGDHQTYSLTNKTTQIGRGSSNEIVLPDDNDISRQHGAILWRHRRWYYVNRKSDIQVKINGKRVKGLKMVRLNDLTQIELGDYIVIFHANELDRNAADLIKTKF